MSDEAKCYAATPAATLEQHITDSNVAKNDAEWWAHHEITRLREELNCWHEASNWPEKSPLALREENARMRDLLDNALGWLDDKEHDKPLMSVDSIRAALAAIREGERDA